MMTRRVPLLVLLIGFGLAACATTEWRTITDINEIAATRTRVDKPGMDMSKVVVLRLRRDGQRVEVSSVTPTVLGRAAHGARAARTVANFTPERDKLMLFGQNVGERKGFYREISVSELRPGERFRFPVVQDDGSVKDLEFIVESLITRP